MPPVPRLSVVRPALPDPTERRRMRLRAAGSAGDPIVCRCGCRELAPAVAGARLDGGRVKGGQRIYLCAACLSRGDRVVLA